MYRILSLDGGGLRGLISLGLIRRVGEAMGNPEWYNRAQLYAGTSTGGIIALGMASGIPLQRIEQLYRTRGPRIFNRKSWWYMSSVFRLLRSGYNNRVLRQELDRLFAATTIQELDRAVVIPSYLLDNRSAVYRRWKPKIFHNLAGSDQDHGLCSHIARYTSAAPSYFPSAGGYIDGAVYANNPSMCALAQALDPRNTNTVAEREISIVSIGTGLTAHYQPGKRHAWGMLRWAPKLIRIVFDGSEGIADYQCRQILGPQRYLRMQPWVEETIELDQPRHIPRIDRLVAA
ncbi:MAG: patatin-like phospholipase family protein, partial [Spirochaeta sp.]